MQHDTSHMWHEVASMQYDMHNLAHAQATGVDARKCTV